MPPASGALAFVGQLEVALVFLVNLSDISRAMAIPKNKNELLQAIDMAYERLKIELLTIPPELTAAAELEGHVKGSVISVNNLLSYLIGWGELVIKWYTKKEAGEAVEFPDTGYRWNELGRLAQKFYKDYEGHGFHALTDRLEQVVSAIRDIVQQKSDTELYGMPWYKQWPLGRMIQFNTSSPYGNARARIRRWKKARGIH